MSFKNTIKQLVNVYCREFKLVGKDAGMLLFFLFLPFAYPIIYSLIYNPELVRDVKMIAVDHDRTAESRDLARRIDACQETWIIGYAADLDEAKRAMHDHQCYGILEIPEGFGKKIGRGEQAPAVIYAEMSLLLRYRGMLMAATNVALDMGAEIQEQKIDLTIPLATTISTGDMMPIHNVSMGDITSGFDSFIMPGVIILILHQCIILAVGMAGGAKHEGYRYTGYVAFNEAPNTLISMLGRLLCYITILLLPILFIAHYVPLIFRFPMAGDNLEIFAFLLPMVLACLGLGFMLQGVIRQRESIFVVWVVTSVVLLFLSGLTWPRYAMHGIWLWLSDIIPATWGVEGFIRMNSNGASIADCSHAYKMLWILAAVYLSLGWVVQKYFVRPASLKIYLQQKNALEDDLK